MNKLLYFFILLILLNQSMSDDVTGCEGGTEDDCSTKTPSDSLYKCEMVKENEEEEAERKCTPVLKTCDEASALKDADCSQLTPANKIGVCFSGNEGCQIAEECGDVTSSATEQICQKFLSNDPTHKCSFIEADSDKSIVAHCESTVRGCTEEVTGVTPNSAIWDNHHVNKQQLVEKLNYPLKQQKIYALTTTQIPNIVLMKEILAL